MNKYRILVCALFFVLACGSIAPPFAQEISNPDKAARDHATLVGLVRTINTAEVTEFYKYGSYASWETLYGHQSEAFHGWLKRYSREANARFVDPPQILPGWELRLNVQSDGKGYVLVLEDANDKTGFAAISDERGIIRLGKYLE